MKMRISVRLDPAVGQRLDQEVRTSGKSESQVVREALVEYLGKRPRGESCLDLARRIRVVGCAKGLPRDLSTNPKHFEGLGK